MDERQVRRVVRDFGGEDLAIGSVTPSKIKVENDSEGKLLQVLEGRVQYVEASVGGSDVADHIADTTDAHDASAISFSPSGTLGSTDVQAAVEEVSADTAAVLTYAQAIDGDFVAHRDDTVDAHDASAISYAGSTNLSSTNVEAALDELDSEKANAGVLCDLYLTASVSTANLGTNNIAWTGEVSDPGGWHAAGSSLIYLPAGTFVVNLHIVFAANATGVRLAGISKNGTIMTWPGQTAMSGIVHRMHTTVIVTSSGSDYIQAVTYQSSGGALNIQGGNAADFSGSNSSWLRILQIG